MSLTIPNTANLLSDFIYKTEWYEIKRWTLEKAWPLTKGFNDCFCLVFVTHGSYAFNISPRKYHTHTGHVIIEKPNFEYSLYNTQGKCTIINFNHEFYEKLCNEPFIKKNSFFSDPSVISQLLLSNSTIEYLHHKLITANSHADKLLMDATVFELVFELLKGAEIVDDGADAAGNFQQHHLEIIERAKAYIHQYFKESIGLKEIAENSFASPFHLSRLFKKFTGCSPYQYLLSIRLKHSEILLKNSNIPIADVAASSGFLNPDNFATAFKRKYKHMPTSYRKGNH